MGCHSEISKVKVISVLLVNSLVLPSAYSDEASCHVVSDPMETPVW